ncbi:hypothetical protein GGS26DRAFT_28668 [Hypomontagnella submonticulosa]|nr:hypothetical protein GGS26DRAFT_28668 [Hypomontagnella submonticulosa]
MKFTVVSAVLAAGCCLGMKTASYASVALSPILEKRDAYSCYGSTNTSVSDCEKVLDTIRNDTQQDIRLYSNVCAVWNEGACNIRFCAQPFVSKPVVRSAEWLVTYITSPLLDGCISKGSMGVISDNPNINSHTGTYRLWVS